MSVDNTDGDLKIKKSILVRPEINDPIDAFAALTEVSSMVEFLQDTLTMDKREVIPELVNSHGLYCILQDIQDRVNKASLVLELADKNETE